MTAPARTLRVVFAGGGTGGHLYPGLAMRDALAAECDRLESLFVGARGGMEETILAGSPTALRLLPGRGLRGASLGARATIPFKLASAATRGLGIIRTFKPHVVVGTGGYASAAMVVAAVIARIPRVLQEQNSVPGLVNRRLSRFADLVLLSYECSREWIRNAGRVVVIGNPLRPMTRPGREEAAASLGLDPGLPTVLVIGGSRGAHSLNLAASEAARRLLTSREVQFLLLVGQSDYAQVARTWEDDRRVRVLAYLEEVQAAYAIADVAVARAGASSVFELAAFGVPAVFVPYPHAADDHQRKNVEGLASSGACVVIDDTDLDGERLSGVLGSLLDDERRRGQMTSALESWVPGDAAARAAQEIMALVKKKPERRRARTMTRVTEGIV